MATVSESLQEIVRLFNGGEYFAAYHLLSECPVDVFSSRELQDLRAEVSHAYHLAMTKSWFPGANYLDWLNWFHSEFSPATYVEIGVESGQSLSLARPFTYAVGVDPEVAIVHSQSAWVRLYKEPSDDFFAANDLREIFGGRDVELSFIDGLHTFDQALKDFINLEVVSSPSGTVLIHDIYPVVPETASRERSTVLWLGDTWKVILILKKYRPDLNVFTIPTWPSGLTVVSGLNPSSDFLRLNYDKIVAEWMSVALTDYIEDLSDYLGVVDNSFSAVKDALRLRELP